MKKSAVVEPLPAKENHPDPYKLQRSLAASGLQRDLAASGLQLGITASETPTAWRLSAFTGRFGEISGAEPGACLTLVFRLVLDAQRQQSPVAWITPHESSFFPPDVAGIGIDLAVLPVVYATDSRTAARVADYLARSGAFGLVVLDLGPGARLSIEIQTRLVGLAKTHDTAIVCITEKADHQPSLGSLVSFRAHTARAHCELERFRCEARMIKDKSHGPGWMHAEVCHGPDGLR